MVVRDKDVLLELANRARLHRLHERADSGRGRLAHCSSPAPLIRCSGYAPCAS